MDLLQTRKRLHYCEQTYITVILNPDTENCAFPLNEMQQYGLERLLAGCRVKVLSFMPSITIASVLSFNNHGSYSASSK